MKGRSGFRRSSPNGMNPVRHPHIFVAPGVSMKDKTSTETEQETRHTRPNTRPKGKNSMVAIVDENTCKGCESCLGTCPAHAITMDNDVAEIDIQLCRGCGNCIDSCPFGAISMHYREKTASPKS